MRRWIERWNAYWFPTTTTDKLALARIMVVGFQLFLFFPSLGQNIKLAQRNTDFLDPQVFISAITTVVPRHVLFTAQGISLLALATVAVGLLALVGLFTRTMVFLFTMGIWTLVAHDYSYGERHHTEAITAIFLLLLALSPSGGSYSLDAIRRRRRLGSDAPPLVVDTAMWPLKLLWVLVSWTYLSAGLTKLIIGGPAWMNGYTLQLYTFNDALNRGYPFGVWLAQHHVLAILLSIGTIGFEVLFCVSLLVPRTAPVFLLGGLLFHYSLYKAAGHNFWQHMTLLIVILLFLAPTWWRSWLDPVFAKLRRRPAMAPAMERATLVRPIDSNRSDRRR